MTKNSKTNTSTETTITKASEANESETTMSTETTTETTITKGLRPYQSEDHNRHASVLRDTEWLADETTTPLSAVGQDSPYLRVINIREGVTAQWDGDIGKDGRYRLDFEDSKLYNPAPKSKAHGIYKLGKHARPGYYAVPANLAERVQAYQGHRESYAARVEAAEAARAEGLKLRKAAWLKFQKKGLPAGFPEPTIKPWLTEGNVILTREDGGRKVTLTIGYVGPVGKSKTGTYGVFSASVSDDTKAGIKALLAL
jgi:hypothetical protein